MSDNGPGIAPFEREKVFKRFYRAKNCRDIPGTGLGLSMAATIATLHGFDLRVEDNQPGAAFVISPRSAKRINFFIINLAAEEVYHHRDAGFLNAATRRRNVANRERGTSHMLAIVRLALRRPYTFVAMAILIAIYGTLAAIRTPVEIFSRISAFRSLASYGAIPACPLTICRAASSISMNVLSPRQSMISSISMLQSVAGYGIVKIFFQPTVDINAAQAQVTAVSQTVLKLLPPGVTPPLVLTYNASSVPIIQVALSSDTLSQAKLNDLGLNFIRPQLATVAGAALPSPYGGVVRQVQVDLDHGALHLNGLICGRCRHCSLRAEPYYACRHRENREVRIYHQSQ